MLNANYLKARLAERGIGEYLPIAFDRTCMHEFVVSGSEAKRRLDEAGAAKRPVVRQPL